MAPCILPPGLTLLKIESPVKERSDHKIHGICFTKQNRNHSTDHRPRTQMRKDKRPLSPGTRIIRRVQTRSSQAMHALMHLLNQKCMFKELCRKGSGGGKLLRSPTGVSDGICAEQVPFSGSATWRVRRRTPFLPTKTEARSVRIFGSRATA